MLFPENKDILRYLSKSGTLTLRQSFNLGQQSILQFCEFSQKCPLQHFLFVLVQDPIFHLVVGSLESPLIWNGSSALLPCVTLTFMKNLGRQLYKVPQGRHFLSSYIFCSKCQRSTQFLRLRLLGGMLPSVLLEHYWLYTCLDPSFSSPEVLLPCAPGLEGTISPTSW